MANFDYDHKKLIIECLGFQKGRTYGFQEYLFNLLDYLHSNRSSLKFSDVILVCKPSQVSNFEPYSENFTILGVKGSESYIGRLWTQTALPFLLKLNREDVILFPGNFSGIIKRCRHILVIHDLLYKRRQLIKNYKMILQRELFVGISIRLADRVIGISKFVANDIKRNFPSSSEKVVPIYNYMNFLKFGCAPSESDSQFFVGVAANYPHKDIATLFRAFGRYCNAGGTRNLKIVGKIDANSEAGHVFASLSQIIKERVQFVYGLSNEELGLIYQQASAFISTSLFEGFGMPIAEAMYFRLPVLLSDIEIHREISMGRGFYFNPQDDEALSELMLKINFVRINYGEVLHYSYDYENTSQKYIQLINQIGGQN